MNFETIYVSVIQVSVILSTVARDGFLLYGCSCKFSIHTNREPLFIMNFETSDKLLARVFAYKL